jgi:hypothetical protein
MDPLVEYEAFARFPRRRAADLRHTVTPALESAPLRGFFCGLLNDRTGCGRTERPR